MNHRRTILKWMVGMPVLCTLSAVSTGLAGRADQGKRSSRTPGSVNTSEEAATLVLSLASLAAEAGTFGVGGALIENKTGRIIKTMRNNVVQRLDNNAGINSGKLYTFDPTAHGERQLVSWYFENVKALDLPPPHELTVITSLDPCSMCAGSLLAAGFNVAIVADDEYAGTNWNKQTDFRRYPGKIASGLAAKFGYYAISGIRGYSGAPQIIFNRLKIASETARKCETTFTRSVDSVRSRSSASGLPPSRLKDPFLLPENSPLKQQWKTKFKHAFMLKLENYRQPTTKLRNILEAELKSAKNAKNAVALIDNFGNLLGLETDHFETSPIDTAFMRLTQNYAKTRFQLMNHEDTAELLEQHMTSPRYGTFVFLYAQDPDDALTLKDLGAYGSSMEGVIPVNEPSNFQFFLPPQKGSVAGLKQLISTMPPFYRELVNINPQQVKS